MTIHFVTKTLIAIAARCTMKNAGSITMKQIMGSVCFLNLLSISIPAHAQSSQQTCKKNSITATTPNSRFEVLGNGGEVKDKQTGLIWQRCSLGQTWNGTSCIGTATQHNWKDALNKSKTVGTGYRLPNIKELKSIVERQCINPAINLQVFPNTQTNDYWSSSPYNNHIYYSRMVNFKYGGENAHYKNSSYFVRAVRSE